MDSQSEARRDLMGKDAKPWIRAWSTAERLVTASFDFADLGAARDGTEATIEVVGASSSLFGDLSSMRPRGAQHLGRACEGSSAARHPVTASFDFADLGAARDSTELAIHVVSASSSLFGDPSSMRAKSPHHLWRACEGT